MLLVRTGVQTALMLAAMAAILFGLSETGAWIEAWVFILIMAGATVWISLWLARHDPDLLRSRLSSPFAGNASTGDLALIVALGLGFLAWLALMALDRRFGWSPISGWLEVVGAAVLILGFALVGWVFAANPFAAPQIRVQAERGQRVVDTGPYRFVRHPMYAGGAVYLLGAALLLGSWWGVLGALVLTLGFGVRAVREEAMLRRHLEGYDDYARRVRARFLPGVW